MTGGRLNWSRISSRERMHRQGVEDIKVKTPLVGQPPKTRLRLSKVAFLAWRAGQATKDK